MHRYHAAMPPPEGASHSEPLPSVTLILPAYNEAARIGPALDELFAYLDGRTEASDGGRPPSEMGKVAVLVVDDGSTDETVAIVERRPEVDGGRLKILCQPHGGKGAAVRAGMLAAGSDEVLFADADLATPPDQLPILTNSLRDHDVALGSRVQPDGSDRRASQPRHRRFVGQLFHTLAALWVTGSVPDTQCGFKGFRRPAARDLFGRQRVTSIVFDAEIIHLARRRGYSIETVPVQWSDKTGSRMRLSPGLAVRVLLDLVRIPLMHRRVPRR